MKSNVLIHEVKLITQISIEFTKKKLTHLSPNQLQWRVNSRSWNIEEVLAHLNSYTQYYNESIGRKLTKTRHTTPTDEFTSSPLGKAAWKGMKLGREKNIKRRFKSPKEFDPSSTPSLITNHLLEDYFIFQNNFLEILEHAQHFNLKRVKLALSISKLSKLRLGDVLLFLGYHHERHIQQILTILQNKDFPKKKYA